MILHIFNFQEKFSIQYFQFLKDNNVDFSNHTLFHYGKKNIFFKKIGIKSYFSRYWVSIIPHIRLINLLFKSDKVIVHSLASPILLLILYIFKKINKKVVWVIWGKDLYFFETLPKKRFYHYIYQYFRRKVISNIAFFSPGLIGDFKILKKNYKISGQLIGLCAYPNALKEYEIIEKKINKKNKFILIVGNSASITNNHIQAFNKLVSKIEKIEKIYCPLSYGGNKKYVESVKKYGYKLFKNKFVPILDFRSKEEYEQILENVDIGIFNNNRQEAMNNIFTLINMGKTIYINDFTTSWFFFEEKNIVIKNFLCFDHLETISKSEVFSNKKNLNTILNNNYIFNMWKKIFDKKVNSTC